MSEFATEHTFQASILPIEAQSKKQKFNLDQAINKSWEIIAPFWPLKKNLVAVKPFTRFEKNLLKKLY